MSLIFVKHLEMPCVERCYINQLALLCLTDTMNTFTIHLMTSVSTVLLKIPSKPDIAVPINSCQVHIFYNMMPSFNKESPLGSAL